MLGLHYIFVIDAVQVYNTGDDNYNFLWMRDDSILQYIMVAHIHTHTQLAASG